MTSRRIMLQDLIRLSEKIAVNNGNYRDRNLVEAVAQDWMYTYPKSDLTLSHVECLYGERFMEVFNKWDKI